jgi:hypothetical protein
VRHRATVFRLQPSSVAAVPLVGWSSRGQAEDNARAEGEGLWGRRRPGERLELATEFGGQTHSGGTWDRHGGILAEAAVIRAARQFDRCPPTIPGQLPRDFRNGHLVHGLRGFAKLRVLFRGGSRRRQLGAGAATAVAGEGVRQGAAGDIHPRGHRRLGDRDRRRRRLPRWEVVLPAFRAARHPAACRDREVTGPEPARSVSARRRPARALTWRSHRLGFVSLFPFLPLFCVEFRTR